MVKKISILATCIFCWTAVSNAEVKIEFPDEELATESVLPVFENKAAVMNRRVKHAKKFEINLMGGIVASEPIYDPLTFGLSFSYHFNNTKGIHIMGVMFSDGLSGSGESLKSDVIDNTGGTGKVSFDATRAPSKDFMIAAHYQYMAYYGKISVTRDSVMNLTLSGLFGGGAYFLDGLIAPTVNLGVSQNLYFTPRVSLKLDLLLSFFNGPDITSTGPLPANGQPGPDPGDFDKTFQFDMNTYVGLSFLL